MAQRADSVDLVVLPTASIEAASVVYGFSLSSLSTSTQDLFAFRIAVPEEGVGSITMPAGWSAGHDYHLGIDLPGRQVFGWSEILGVEPLDPGSTRTGFSFESPWFPGSAPFWAQGWTPIPEIPPEDPIPEVVVGDLLYENSVTGQTLGPAFPPDEVATPEPTAAALEEVLTLSCDEEWVSDPAVCTLLDEALDDVQTAIAAGDPGAAGAALDAFEQIVDAGVDVTINQSAFSVLDLYIARLRGQGLVPDLGGEGCGPGYWKQSQHFDSWQNHGPSDSFDSAFVDAFPGKTLEDVLGQGGGGLNSLGRQTVAALLNAEHADVAYALTPSVVISEFDAAYGEGGGAIGDQKNRFEGFNEEACPLN